MNNSVTGRNYPGETLRLKVGLVTGMAMMGIFLFALGVTSRLLVTYFGEVQDQISLNRLQSTATILGQLTSARVKTTVDYASSSFLEAFLSDMNSGLVSPASSLGRFPDQDTVFIFDHRRQLVAAIRPEPAVQSVGSPGSIDLDQLAQSHLLAAHPVAGFTEENGRCLLLTACPVQNDLGENLGWLVFGAFLSERLIHDLESVSLGWMQIRTTPESSSETSSRRWYRQVLENKYMGAFEMSFVLSSDLAADAEALSARLSFRNLLSQTPIVFEFGLPANVYAGASKARDFIIVVALISGVVFLGIVLLSVEFSVLRPLAALDREMQRLSGSQDGTLQLSEKRGDEIGRLARSANVLLSKIASGRESAKEQRDLLRGVLNSTTEGVVAMRALRDRGGRIYDFEFVMANQPAAHFFGKSPPEMVGALRSSVQPPPGAQDMDCFKSVILTRRPESFEQCYNRMGKNAWYHLSVTPWGDGIVVSFEDITERKERESALERSMEELERFNEAMIGREQRIIELKREINDILAELGRPPLMKAPPTMFDDQHSDQRSRYLEAVSEALSLLLKPGDFHAEMEEALCILGEASRAARICVYENIFEPSESDAYVRESFRWRRQGTPLSEDQSQLERIPYKPDFTRWWDALSQGQLICGLVRDFPSQESELLTNLRVQSVAIVPIMVGGRFWGFLAKVSHEPLIWEEFELHALRAAVAGIGGALAREQNDAALRRQAEELRLHRKAALSLMEDARRASQSAEQASRAKSTFLAMMSHEIRTPLNGVIGFTDLLLAEGLPAAQEDYAHAIRACGETLLGLITDILDISKIESGRLDLDYRDGDFYECVRSVITTVEVTARQKDLSLSLDWDPRTPVFLTADFNRLRQVIFNLLGNAIKFTSRGSVALRVWPEETNDDGFKIHCSVKDTGPGISASEIERIFDPFTQGRMGASVTQSGAGLGLTICRKLIEAMKGEIRVTSELGHGSEFHFFFPARLASASSPVRDSAGEGLPKDLSDVRVLVVDDVATNLMVAERLLKRFGLHAQTVSSGEEALQRIQESPFDLVFMDVLMPGMNGHDTTRKLRSLESELNGMRPWVIALTADALPENRQLCQEAGMDDFITKPLRYPDIEACLLRWRSSKAS